VLNALWYPHYAYDLPVLGIDLISLGKNRVLNVIDFQPLQTSTDYSLKYIEHLTAIRNKYPELQGNLRSIYLEYVPPMLQYMIQ